MMRERFKNYKTGKKMAVAFISIIILYIITVVTALFNIESVSSRMDRLYNEPFANVQSSLRMIANLRAVDRNIVLMAATDELVDEDRYLENTKELIQSEEAALTQLSTGYITAPEKVKELQEEFQKLAVSRTRIMSLLEEGENREVLKEYVDSYLPQANTVRTVLNDVVDLSVADIGTAHDIAQLADQGCLHLIHLHDPLRSPAQYGLYYGICKGFAEHKQEDPLHLSRHLHQNPCLQFLRLSQNTADLLIGQDLKCRYLQFNGLVHHLRQGGDCISGSYISNFH